VAQPKGIRRVVTTHDSKGKSVVGFDGIAPVSGGEPELGVESITLWVTDDTPADLTGSKDAGKTKVGIPPPKNGSIFRIVDFHPTPKTEDLDPNFLAKITGQKLEPGAKTPRHPGMHKTRTIDYLAVLSGEIDMLLDDSEIHLKTGDVLVQRGTVHAWVNRGTEVCRIAVVNIDAKDLGAKSKRSSAKTRSKAKPARAASAGKKGKRTRGKR
jgi:quercetin dioxygenase-like cupin family protein